MTDTAPFVLAAPRFETRDAFVVAGLREPYRFANGDFAVAIGEQWDRLWPRLAAVLSAEPGVMYGMSFLADADPDGFDYLCGAEIDANSDPGDLDVARIPALRYAVFRHDRPFSELRLAIDAIYGTWLPASGHALAQADGAPSLIERYGPEFDPAAEVGDLELWLPIAPE